MKEGWCLPLWVLSVTVLSEHAAAQVRCNTRSGFVANQPEPPPFQPNEESSPSDAPDSPGSNATERLNSQTLRIDLARDLDSLAGFPGPITSGASVLGVRFENFPGFDPRRHCNAILPIVYKPRLQTLPDGKVRASVDNGRFHIEFSEPSRQTWVQDADPSGQFFWIFPRLYGRNPRTGAKWALTQSYDAEFRRAPPGSLKRRWVAEAYINLTMRLYRHRRLAQHFPTGWRPTRADLNEALEARLGSRCDGANADLICLAARLIEVNEAAPPLNLISADAFRAGDALLENSGVSTGIRQLDFGTRNAQASALAGTLMPTTIGRDKVGYGYRRPIRAWPVALWNKWYSHDGPIANSELSREEAKRTILQSHADFLRETSAFWWNKLEAAYPSWSIDERKALAMMAIDLENVSGYQLFLPSEAKAICTVLNDTSIWGKRSNRSVVRNQIRRVRNGVEIWKAVPSTTPIDFGCVSSDS